MTADLSTLPQHVREAVDHIGTYVDGKLIGKELETIRAELLRLTGENAELRAHIEENYLDVGGVLSAWKKEKARAERAESELAALRKRIAEAPIYEMPLRKPTDDAGWCGVIASAKALKEARGKRVALLAMTDEDKA